MVSFYSRIFLKHQRLHMEKLREHMISSIRLSSRKKSMSTLLSLPSQTRIMRLSGISDQRASIRMEWIPRLKSKENARQLTRNGRVQVSSRSVDLNWDQLSHTPFSSSKLIRLQEKSLLTLKILLMRRICTAHGS